MSEKKHCATNFYKTKILASSFDKCYSRRGTHSGDSGNTNVEVTSDAIRRFSRVTDSKLTGSYLDELIQSGVEEDPLGDHRNILYPEILNRRSTEEEEHDE